MKRVAIALFIAAAIQSIPVAPVLASPSPVIANASDGIFVAFQTHPLVGIGEWHGLGQELDFYSVLIRDPRFAKDVGNVVVEIGGAAQQETVDRYVNGENIPYSELRKVWTDVVGWFPPTSSLGSINIFATVREVNLALSPGDRIKVWLGEPPIDWSQIKSRADWEPLAAQRDIHPAELIKREILAKSKKALVIYGIGHLGLYPGPDDLRTLLAAGYPKALFIVAPYTGYTDSACSATFEKAVRHWPVPALASPIIGSTLESRMLPRGCSTLPVPTAEQKKQYDLSDRNNIGLTSDALLYLGPSDTLRRSVSVPDLYLDQDFHDEMDRRYRLISGQPMPARDTKRNPGVSQPWWVNGVPGG